MMIYHIAESDPWKKKIPTDFISDSKSSEEEISQHLRTSPEERLYHTIKGSAQATQAALAQLKEDWQNSQRERNSLKNKLQIK